MLTNQLPTWGRKPIEGYFQTGQFKNHERFPMPAEDSEGGAEEFKAHRDYFVSLDNTDSDPDKRPGFVEGAMPWLGDFKGQFMSSENDKTTDTFQHFGADSPNNQAIIYTRETPTAFHQIVVTRDAGGADDGVMFFSTDDPSKSFITFPPE